MKTSATRLALRRVGLIGGALTIADKRRKNGLLRRLEYPAAAMVPALAQDPNLSDLSLTAELKGAQLNPAFPAEKFVLAVHVGAKKMKSLVMPPQPLPSDLFGQQVGEFFLRGAIALA